jgi:hypothetical protein
MEVRGHNEWPMSINTLSISGLFCWAGHKIALSVKKLGAEPEWKIR